MSARSPRSNRPANTGPHLHKAASPQIVAVRLPLRYTERSLLSLSL
jgi:hypothetical protein